MALPISGEISRIHECSFSSSNGHFPMLHVSGRNHPNTATTFPGPSPMKLTSQIAEEIACPPGKSELIVFDEATPGFGFRVRASGVRRWIVQYETHGQTKRITIGPPDLFTAEQARRIARERLAKARLGADPAAEKAAERIAAKLTFGSVVDRYIADREGKLRPHSMRQLRYYLLKWWKPLHGMPLHKITRRDVAAHLSGPPVAAARARSLLMMFYSWAMQQGLVEINPVIGTGIPDEHIKPRERVLSDFELAKIWAACGDNLYGKIVRLLILTGCRRQEVGSMQWHELDQDKGAWTIPGERTKNGRAHTLPLPTMAWEIIATVPQWRDGEFLFGRRSGHSGWAQDKDALDQRAGVAEWHLHDIRRSVATGMAEIGVQPHIVEAILNHATFRKGVASIYNKATYGREMKAALAMWADHVRSLVEGGERKIVQLHQ
jgi:integrase